MDMAPPYHLLYVGTAFGDAESPTHAILRIALSSEDGALSIAAEPVPTAGVNPGWMSRCEGGKFVYVAMEDDPGSLQAFAIGAGGGLTPIGEPVSSAGRHPCYCTLDRTGKWLLAANYSSGSVSVVPVLPDGSLGRPTDSKHHGGATPPPLHDRQEAAHAHSVLLHPSNKWAVACDLGLSTVFVYGFDAEYGALRGSADDPRHLRAAPDDGCRHACWDESGKILLTCTVTAAWFDAETGALKALPPVSALPPGAAPNRSHHRGGSDIALHPNGKLLFAGVRGPSPGLIAMFLVEGSGGSFRLKLIGHESTRGEVPRNFKLVDGGRWLVVGNQESKTLVSFAVDAEAGSLRFASQISTAPHKPCNIAGQTALFP